MDIRVAILIREVDACEAWNEVINEAKAMTWTHRCEVALLRVDSGMLLLVRGGADGIEFEVLDDSVFVTVAGSKRRVLSLAWHTHPRPTGPSDHDRRFLQVLNQESSMIYEMFSDGRGTRFFAANRSEES